jgi:hypothetical protein
MRSWAKRVAATASRTGSAPTISEAWETVVSARPENWMRNWSGIPREEASRRRPQSARLKQGREREGGEEEAVEDHGADVHLDEGDLAEVEAAAPERAGEGAGCEAESAVFRRLRHNGSRSRKSRVN